MVPSSDSVCFWSFSHVTCIAYEGRSVILLLSSLFLPSFFPFDGFRPLILPLFAPSHRIHQIDSLHCLPCRFLGFRLIPHHRFQIILSPNALSEIVQIILSPNALSEIYQRFSWIHCDFCESGRPYSVIQKMSFEIGESVEVIGNEDGMEGSYFKGQVIDRSPGRRTIRYQSLLADDGSLLEKVISIRRLRPPPPIVLARFHLGDMVDAWHNEGWWVGMYVRREGEKYTVVRT
ncbi:hypothetical protein LXL04_000826 [Taraxacum kok-saghyz]